MTFGNDIIIEEFLFFHMVSLQKRLADYESASQQFESARRLQETIRGKWSSENFFFHFNETLFLISATHHPIHTGPLPYNHYGVI